MTTIAVKIGASSDTPIQSCLDVGASGNWIIAKEDLDSITKIELYDESSGNVYSSQVQAVVPVRSNDSKSRFLVVFDRYQISCTHLEYSQKGFSFPGHGVLIKDKG